MDSKTYIANAIKTESVPTSLEINQIGLHAVLGLSIAASKLADLVKRKLYYGKVIDKAAFEGEIAMIGNMAAYLYALNQADQLNDRANQESIDAMGLALDVKDMKLENLNPRLLHSAIGIFTESGELLEAMLKQYETGELDLVNFGEEIGDLSWYAAIGFDETGVSEDECREKNIAKLKARYVGMFSTEAALNRDLVAERAILEA